MLKKDLKGKIVFNITLLVFMIMATVLATTGTVLLYTRITGDTRTYEKCNTSDMLMITAQNVSDYNAHFEKVDNKIKEFQEFTDVNKREIILIGRDCVKFGQGDDEEGNQLQNVRMYMSKVPTIQNIPYDMDDRRFGVKNGYVAIPQNLHNSTSINIGDTIRITTQMGNIYEFIVSAVYKDPVANSIAGLYFSDADYKVLAKDSPAKYDLYEMQIDVGEKDEIEWIVNQAMLFSKDLKDEYISGCYAGKFMNLSNDGIISMVVAIVMMVVSVFFILIIFITISFTLKSAIKREEKEIGMMKAIGVYSLAYRAIFAAKYLAFAVLGGLIGIPVSMPLIKYTTSTFIINIVYPEIMTVLLLSVASTCVCVAVIIGFIFFSMRRMNKITVMDAIHGENRGERFHKIPGFFLHNQRNIKIPLFLAVSDIFGKLKRYIYLIFACVGGIGILLIVYQVKDSILSVKYMQKYWQMGQIDFVFDIDADYFSKLYEKTGSSKSAYKIINDNFEVNGIPAKIENFDLSYATLKVGENEYEYCLLFGEPDTTEMFFNEGGHAPVLENEIALSYYNSKYAGINLGDTVTISYNVLSDNGVTQNEVEKKFVVTAFFEGMGMGVPQAIMGNEFSGAVVEGDMFYSSRLECKAGEYDYYFEKMCALYESDEIVFHDRSEVINHFLADFVSLFDMLVKFIVVIVGVVFAYLTLLYQDIFIEEETGDIAMLKSMGFSNFSVKMWYYCRMIILMLISIAGAHLLINTLGHMIVGKLIASTLYLVSFDIEISALKSFVIIPIVSLVLISLVMIVALRRINNIQIWRIRNE